MAARYRWRSDTTKLLRMLRASLAMKKKCRWSRETGAGFIVADISDVRLRADNLIRIHFDLTPGSKLYNDYPVSILNLRETEELIKYLEKTG